MMLGTEGHTKVPKFASKFTLMPISYNLLGEIIERIKLVKILVINIWVKYYKTMLKVSIKCF